MEGEKSGAVTIKKNIFEEFCYKEEQSSGVLTVGKRRA